MPRRTGVIAATFLAASVLIPNVAHADPVTVNGALSAGFTGAQFIEDISFSFPGFNLDISNLTHLQPGICECSGPQPLTQTTGNFQGQASVTGTTGGSSANVQGRLNFVGPVVIVPSVNGPFENVSVTDNITWSGFLNVTQGQQTLFNGMLSGTGTGTIGLGQRESDFFYGYLLQGASATPEPASVVLIGTGIAWIAAMRRRRTPKVTSSMN